VSSIVKFHPASGVMFSELSGAVLASTTYTQTYATADTTVPTATAAAVATTAATNSSPYGFSQTQADAIVTNVNALVADSLQNRKLLNSIIDTLQALGLAL
jgi:hypothetical protein